ncbi:hypothetical protein A3D85_02180 [Candidatus Amesbacteria bacterium RIFCSPHIGHO2_02_FULL_47_9]|uniref:Uncharacterized protein n=1 Tax=Candidatus Amesbacteria bacterium RIFCSPHIGHO2_01_FULL_48_32b TaxID=1797253 RepID=A0A1F4YDC4_9BACT|nr:MAG: hypothetical protein A2876_01445 [Candidatus Amesbacteria bacterium RIFCSPHIGHO2_01_FULL_48_32b]OGD04869.1 MAG: hypothetical protein A3D85_02180 [Candidatus Amesbacteria bacterium RIFCSPHIGHO2_02_FULL_47_9]OGD08045.1 MAG: hypothetical protein A2899_00800 [Candidatus Amesbacteria bacterium RIFCSPLOWO2_01_FULL_49_25]
MSIVIRFLKLHLAIRLLVIYWVFIGLMWLTLFTPLGTCRGGFDICFPAAIFLIMIPSIPGILILNKIAPAISPSFGSWITYSENLTQVTFIGYFITSLLLILAGMLFGHHPKISVPVRIRRKS